MNMHSGELQTRFNKAVQAAKAKNKLNKNRAARKKFEVELSHAIREVESYGFNFYPEIYVQPTIERIEKMTATVQVQETAKAG